MTDYYDGPVPPPDADDLADVLEDVEAFVRRFVVLPTEHAYVAAVLWAAHAHVVDCFETSPRIAFLSPEPGSGKTRALEILELLVPHPLLTSNVSVAYVVRKLADEPRPVLLLDETDTIFGPKAKSEAEELRGLLNTGYRRGATSGRCVVRGKEVFTEEFPSFAAVAMAGLNDLPDTIGTRSVLVHMRRRAPHEIVSPYRRRVHEREGHELRARLADALAPHTATLADAWPDLPEQITDRAADVWEPLLAIADAAGDEWPDRARVSAVSAVSASQEGRGSIGVRLLADVKKVFSSRGMPEAMKSMDVLEGLYALEDAPWNTLRNGPLTPGDLAQRLRAYGIAKKQVKALGTKGYIRAELEDAWLRYLPSPPSQESETPETPETGEGEGW